MHEFDPDASDDEDFQTQYFEEFSCYTDLETLLGRPAHLAIFLNYTIMQNKPNYLLFALSVHHYRRQEKLKNVRKAANEIFTDFLNPSAVLRVSFSPDVLNEITHNLNLYKDNKQLQTIYDRARNVATKHVNQHIREFKNKLDMGLGNAYNVQLLFGLNSREQEIKVAKQILIEKFEELMKELNGENLKRKDTNVLHEEKNKALIAAVNYLLEDIGVIHGSASIARSYSMNRRDVDKIAKKLHGLRNRDHAKGFSSLNPLSSKKEAPTEMDSAESARKEVAPLLAEDGSIEDLHEPSNNLLSPSVDSAVKRSKSLPKDHSVQRPLPGISRPKSAAEDADMFTNNLIKRTSLSISDDVHSSNSSDVSSRHLTGSKSGLHEFGSGTLSESRRSNLIEFDWDSDLDVPDDMSVWSQEFSQVIKTRNMNKKQIQRQDVIQEFIHTEKHYLRKLKVLNLVYYNPLHQHGLMEQVRLLWLFPNLDELIQIHKEFCEKLIQRQSEVNPVSHVCDIIIKHLSRSDLKEACAKFCNHQKSALAMFKDILVKSPDLRSFVQAAENHVVSKRLDLDQLLGCVLHRITKYPLLLSELKKATKDENNPDFELLNEAIKLSKELANFVNLRIRESENESRLEKLQKQIDNQITDDYKKMGHLANMRINAPHRKLMYDGNLILMIDKTHSLELLGLLMTDCIVLLQKSDAKYLLKPLSHELCNTEAKSPVIMLADIHLTPFDKREKRFYIVNTNPSAPEMYELRCANKDSKETWIQKIESAIQQYKTGNVKHLSDNDFTQASNKVPSDDSEDSSVTESETESETEELSHTDNTVEDSTVQTTIPKAAAVPQPSPVTSTTLSTPSPNPQKSPKLFAYNKNKGPSPSSASSSSASSSTRDPRRDPLARAAGGGGGNHGNYTNSRERQAKQDDVDTLTDLSNQDLIINAMNEIRNIQRLSFSIGIDADSDDSLKQRIQKATSSLNKHLQQLLRGVITDSEALSRLEEENSRLKKLLREKGIDT